MKITEEMVNKAFDAYLESFNILAEQEDLFEDMKLEIQDYKEGSAKFEQAKLKLQEFERTMAEPQRNMRKAALELDRIKTLVSMQ